MHGSTCGANVKADAYFQLMSYIITNIQSKYVAQIVDVHIEAFPDFFLTFLGPRFLKEFYDSFTYDPTGVGFVAQDSDTGDILGVIVGPVVPDGYFRRLLKRRWWAFCLASVTAVLKRPTVIRRLFRAVFYRGEPLQGPKRALLSSIAVRSSAQGQGIGKKLVNAWCSEVKKRGSTGCYLTTDTRNNDAINQFYQRCGWKIAATKTTPEGREMNYYIYDFTQKT